MEKYNINPYGLSYEYWRKWNLLIEEADRYDGINMNMESVLLSRLCDVYIKCVTKYPSSDLSTIVKNADKPYTQYRVSYNVTPDFSILSDYSDTVDNNEYKKYILNMFLYTHPGIVKDIIDYAFNTTTIMTKAEAINNLTVSADRVYQALDLMDKVARDIEKTMKNTVINFNNEDNHE